MKNTKILILFILTLILSFCSKGSDEPSSTNNSATPSKQCYVSTVMRNGLLAYKYEFSDSLLSKTIWYNESGVAFASSEIQYSNGIVSSVTDYESGVPTTKIECEISNDKIVKLKRYYYNPDNSLDYYSYYNLTYDSNSKLIKKEFYIVETGLRKTYYTYRWENENLIEQKIYSDDNNNISLFSTTVYNYDTHKNPYYKVGLEYISPEEFSKNNIISSSSIDTYTSTLRNFTYEYNSDSYPIKLTELDRNGNNTVREFIYTCP